MKKLFTAALFALVSSFAFAAGPLVPNEQPQVNALYDTSAQYAATSVTPQDVKQAAPAPASTPAKSSLEQGAGKLGSFVGGLFKGSVNVAKAFGKGVSQAMSEHPSDTVAQASTETASAEHSASRSTSQETSNRSAQSVNSFASAPLAVLAALSKRGKDEQVAVVEERSSFASKHE